MGTRRAQAIAKVVVALAVECAGGRVAALTAAAGSVAPRTVRLDALAAELVGHAPEPERIRRAARAAAERDASPVDDVRSTARYRREVLYRVLASLLAELCRNPGP